MRTHTDVPRTRTIPSHPSMERWREFYGASLDRPITHERLRQFLHRFHEIFSAFDPLDAYRIASRDSSADSLPSALKHFDVPLGGIQMLRLPIETMSREVTIMERLLEDGSAADVRRETLRKAREGLARMETAERPAKFLHLSVVDDVIDSFAGRLLGICSKAEELQGDDASDTPTKKAAGAFARTAEDFH